jgi:hypothetical protein
MKEKSVNNNQFIELPYTLLSADANPIGKGCIIASQFIKESKKHILYKVPLVLQYLYSGNIHASYAGGPEFKSRVLCL